MTWRRASSRCRCGSRRLGYSGGLVILAIALIDELVNVLKGNRPSYEKEPPATPDEFVERVASGGAG